MGPVEAKHVFMCSRSKSEAPSSLCEVCKEVKLVSTRVWRLSVPVNLPEVLQRDAIFTEKSSVHNLR